ncbi:MAG: HNH endonuclease [Bacilli bacterium]|nr:HNH endonuclease [Bacilli bacterium]
MASKKIEERKKWFEENVQKFDSMDEMTKSFNEHFGLNLTKSGVQRYFYKTLKMKMGQRFYFSEEETEWIKENYYKYRLEELTKKFNKVFNKSVSCGKINSKIYNMGLSYFQANEISYSESHSKLKIGDIVVPENSPAYIKIKEGQKKNNYIYATRYFYEKYYGPIENPDDYIVIQLDGDKSNFSKENLKLISRKEQGSIMKFGAINDVNLFGQGKITEAIISVVKLEALVKNMEKGE